MENQLLSIITFLPLVAAIILALFMRGDDAAARQGAKWLALFTTTATFVISLFQSVTQIQEATLSFVPKAIAIGAVLLLTGNWILREMMTFTVQLFEKIPALLS